MIRRRNFLIFGLLVFFLFALSTNYLLIILPSTESEVGKPRILTIEEKIYYELKKLPEHYKQNSLVENKDKIVDVFLKNIKSTVGKIEDLNLVKLWAEANFWVSKTQLLNISSPNLGKVFFALKNAKITKADLDTRGTQLKLLLTLEGDQQAIFKPQWYPIEKIIEGPVYAGKDRYFCEIVAFYLSIILNRPLTPISVERKISLKRDVLPVATKRLLDASFERNNRSCVYGKCYFCKKDDPICDDRNDFLNGAVIFNFRAALSNNRSPWQRTYVKGRKAQWEVSPDTYCKTVRGKLSKKRVYDLIDTSIFDFLLQNGDRHHYETLSDTVLWLDNGKGLGNPNLHHVDILAPLYQCCILRRSMYKTLLGLAGGRLKESLKLMMPESETLLTKEHLKAMEERLLIVFATIEYCRHNKQEEHYLL